MNFCDMACEILRVTRDGDDLEPFHLGLVQEACNGGLNEAGEIAFYELHTLALAGYKKPWFHGIEHMTIDHIGYVYWKGQHVEHYTLGWHRSREARQAASELSSRCRELEEKRLPVSVMTAIWFYENKVAEPPYHNV